MAEQELVNRAADIAESKLIIKPFDDISEDDVWLMGKSVLWHLGRKYVNPPTSGFWGDPYQSANMGIDYCHYPKNSFFMQGSIDIEKTEHEGEIILFKDLSLQQLAQIGRKGYPEFSYVHITSGILTTRQRPNNRSYQTHFMRGKYPDNINPEKSAFTRGPWLEDLRELYNFMVERIYWSDIKDQY